jgi:hypothetical protein
MIGAVSIVALTLGAVAESSAQYISDLPDRDLCASALNRERSAWDQSSTFSKEAAKRGLTVDTCSEILGDVEEAATSTHSGTSEQRAFLEAAFFFITGVDATAQEIVTNREIHLDRYPIVGYLVDDNRCAIRIRTTTQLYVVWQMDFCKITHYEDSTKYSNRTVTWRGYKTAFCTHRGWDKNTNYTGLINKQNSRCGLYDQSDSEYMKNWHIVWTSAFDAHGLLDGKARTGGRSVDRMIASFKYITTLLAGKPY